MADLSPAELIDLVEDAYEEENGIRVSIPRVTKALTEIVEERNNLRAFVQDLAACGLRTDMHPTVIINEETTTMYSHLTEYFSGAEDRLRQRAKGVLGQ
jgi:hypothetical protein